MKGLDQFEYAENLLRKAEVSLSQAKEGLKRYTSSYSSIIANCQNAIELSTKAIFKLVGLEFPRSHQLLFEQKKEGKKIRESVKKLLQSNFPKYFAYKEELPRVIFLTYFWGQFYTIAKYGIDELNLPPDELFKKEDAELAVSHAELCVRVANELLAQRRVEGSE